MRFVAGSLNKVWLDDILEKSKSDVERIKIAVAYADANPKIIDLCFNENIPLEFWCRYDYTVPVPTSLLERFLIKQSPNYVCKLVPDIFHPKVIWWVGFGAYIGSANLTSRGWTKNIECGLFFSESEMITQGIMKEIEVFFDSIDEQSHPLTKEILDDLKEQEKKYAAFWNGASSAQEEFKKKRRIPERTSIASVNKVSAEQRRKEAFLKEWNATLQIMRDIQARVSDPSNRPAWVNDSVPPGVQADQFLHAYYYNNVKKGNRYPFEEHFEKNKGNPEAALSSAIKWWKNLPAAPSNENITMYEWYPVVKNLITKQKLPGLNLVEFADLCARCHAIRDHASKVENLVLGVPQNTPQKTVDQSVKLLANFLWNQKTTANNGILDVLNYVLYGGKIEDTPERIWTIETDPSWDIPHFGISSVGELAGWAFPDSFPPRNGRSSKALRSLGYKVTVHSK